ncbi:MAG TPA: CHRD domain-containing protein [Bryobacteraceae bacterium]|nr:CHRD domain-containing protein [Bryobacteraceae bacterium]
MAGCGGHMRTLQLGMCILLFASICFSAPVTLTGTLSGPAEFPPNSSPGTGFTTVTYDAATHFMSVAVTFQGLIAGVTAAHIHCCVSRFAATPTAGVATIVPTFPGFPSGVTSGTYSNPFNMSLAASYNPSFITNNGGTAASAEAAFSAALLAGNTYLNIHTSAYPGGEIRSFLDPVPEPGTALLAITGLAGLCGLRRNRRGQP